MAWGDGADVARPGGTGGHGCERAAGEGGRTTRSPCLSGRWRGGQGGEGREDEPAATEEINATAIRAMTVKQLRDEVSRAGLDARACFEKADFVQLLLDRS